MSTACARCWSAPRSRRSRRAGWAAWRTSRRWPAWNGAVATWRASSWVRRSTSTVSGWPRPCPSSARCDRVRTARVIPCLDVTDGRVVKGVNFVGLRDAGDPVELAARYDAEGADELVFLDITASSGRRDTMVEVARRTAEEVFIPFTIGGGIRRLDDARRLLRAGADKVSVNTSAVERPELISELSGEYGAQCVVCAIDAKARPGGWEVYLHGGRTPTRIGVLAWGTEAGPRGAGEILLTSMGRDGAPDGHDSVLKKGGGDGAHAPVVA